MSGAIRHRGAARTALLCGFLLTCLASAGWALWVDNPVAFFGSLVAGLVVHEWTDRHHRGARRREFWWGTR